jgi:NAD(P)-dependent dehydrogenase (short-subunit alcohol dehydrogenase family)
MGSSGEKKVAIVTGGNRGLGLATAKKLARSGYHVVLAARDEAATAAAADELRREIPGAEADAMRLDLSSLASVRAFADAFRARGLPLHLLLNNAGLIGRDQLQKSGDGLEIQLATNHLGHFLLTRLLEDILVRSAPARVVVVASQVHAPGNGPGKGPDFDYDNLDGSKYYDSMVFYRNSKLANVWFTYALARRLEGKGVTVNALCPGFVPETGATNAKGMQRFLMRFVFPLMPFARSVERASTHMTWVATAPELANVTAKFFVDQKEHPSSPESHDVAKQERLWDFSERTIERLSSAGAPAARAAVG